jgi:hypothetical protein
MAKSTLQQLMHGSSNTAIAKRLINDAPIDIFEALAPAAAGTATIKTAIASQLAIASYSGAALNGTIGAGAISPPRNITVTTAGTTPADAPATATITGTDANGAALTETITVSQTAATAAGVKCFATVTKIDLPVGDGTGATLAFGTGAILGFPAKVENRGGGVAVVKEIVDGAIPGTAGTFASATTSPPNGSYTPNTAPNGAHSYCVYFERATP